MSRSSEIWTERSNKLDCAATISFSNRRPDFSSLDKSFDAKYPTVTFKSSIWKHKISGIALTYFDFLEANTWFVSNSTEGYKVIWRFRLSALMSRKKSCSSLTSSTCSSYLLITSCIGRDITKFSSISESTTSAASAPIVARSWRFYLISWIAPWGKKISLYIPGLSIVSKRFCEEGNDLSYQHLPEVWQDLLLSKQVHQASEEHLGLWICFSFCELLTPIENVNASIKSHESIYSSDENWKKPKKHKSKRKKVWQSVVAT